MAKSANKNDYGKIDYSKWDKIDYGSDSDCSDEVNEKNNNPRVTCLDSPSEVTRSPDGSISIKQQRTKEDPSTNFDDKVQPYIGKNPISPGRRVKFLKEKQNLMTQNGGKYSDPNTGVQSFWSQDRYRVILSVLFNSANYSSKDISVSVIGALPYEDRHCAVMKETRIDGEHEVKGEGSHGFLRACATNKHENKTEISLIEGYLPYPIHLDEDEEEVDWNISTDESPISSSKSDRIIKIYLNKAVPMGGITIWWNRPLMDYPQINTQTDIEGRNVIKSCKNDNNSNNRETEMKRVWDEAHRLYRERIKMNKNNINKI